MRAPEPVSIDELIADCADMPPRLTTHDDLSRLIPRAAAPWAVNDTCLEAVQDLEDFYV